MQRNSSRGWLILIVLVLGTAMINYANMIFASRPVEMMAQFSMSQTQLTAISTVGVLPGAFFSIVMGNYFDKHGVKATKYVGAFLLILGAACMLWRVFANSYAQLFIITFLSGTLFLPTQVLPAKMISLWFDRQKQGVAMGIYGAAAGMGIMLAFAVGSMFPTSFSALLSCAVGYAVTAVLWLLFVTLPEGMEQPQEQAAQDGPKVDLKAVFKSKSMWLVMACSGIAASMPLLFNSYVVNAFLDKGMDPSITGLLGVVFNISLVAGAILAGLVVAKIGKYNGAYLVLCVIGGAFLLLTYLVPVGPMSFVCLALGGLFGAGSLSVNLTRIGLLPLTKEFGPENCGIAGGMNNTAMGIGMFILPVIISAIFGTNHFAIFSVIFAFFVVMGLIGCFLMPELGEKGALAKAAKESAE